MIEADHGAEEDFRNQWGLKAIRADRAYAHLELEHGAGTQPGSGQTVGLIDTGIDTAHQVFAGKTVTEEHLNNAPEETGDERSHGTAVASVIVERPSAAFTASVTAARGVARGADVAMFAVPAGSGGGNYVPISLPGLASADDRWATRFNHVINWSNGGQSIDFVKLGIHFALVSPTFGFRGCDDRRLGPCRGPARAAPPAGAVGRKAGHEPANGGD